MFRKILFALLIISPALISCTSPQPWAQFHTNGPNQGFILVNSGVALEPKWSVSIGPVAYSSPAIGADGTIYVGTTEGELVAVNSSGTIRWKKTIAANSAIVSSPAVGTDNNIYLISVPETTDEEKFWSSTLHSVTPEGDIKWSRTFPDGFTTGSAKTWETGGKLYIFVHIMRIPYTQLVIFDQDGNEIHRENVCGAEIEGGYPIPSDWWRIFTGGLPFIFTTPGVRDPSHPLGPFYPTVAIVDYPPISPNQPMIIVADNTCGIRAYRWNPPNLSHLWDQIHRDINYSSPAVDPGGFLAIGKDDGHIVAYDTQTGTPQWDYDAKEPITATPAVFVSYVYAVSLNHLHVIDSRDGQLVYKFDLDGNSVSSPALTANHLYVSSDRGFYTFDHLPAPTADITLQDKAAGGFSSPAVDVDGTVYMVTSSGFLQAFPPP